MRSAGTLLRAVSDAGSYRGVRRLSIPARVFFPLPLLLALIAIVYSPGLSGPFLLDDFSNLNALGELGGVTSWGDAIRFAMGGGSVSGRPISLASFLINDFGWPSDPRSFKYTNICLHLLNTSVLFWLVLLILRVQSLREGRAAGYALVVAALWGLHPLHVSTVLYPVQRMAILSTTFVLIGLVCFVKGRVLVATNRRMGGLAILSFGMPICFALAVLSKENGVLLPLLALVLEGTLLAPLVQRERLRPLVRNSIRMLLSVPLVLVAVYLVVRWDDKIAPMYAFRDFGLMERLMTESRVIFQYLYDLLVPKAQTAGLYYDNFQVSRGLLEPPTTLASLSGAMAVLAAALFWRRSMPLLCGAVLFFFAGHALESTFVPLELYFEHRNYLAAALLFLPVIPLLERVARLPLRIASGFAIISILATLTLARADLWGDGDRLALVWVTKNPDSIRTQQQAAMVRQKYGQLDLAMGHIDAARESNRQQIVLYIQGALLKCVASEDPSPVMKAAVQVARHGSVSKYTVTNLERLIDIHQEGRCPKGSMRDVVVLINTLLEHPVARGNAGFRHDLLYYQGLALMYVDEKNAAIDAMLEAFETRPSVTGGMQVAATLATFCALDDAERLLGRIATLGNERLGVEIITNPKGHLRSATAIDEIPRILVNIAADRGTRCLAASD